MTRLPPPSGDHSCHLILGLFFVGQVGLLSSLVNFGALFAFLMLHISVVVYFLIKRRGRTFGAHLLSPPSASSSSPSYSRMPTCMRKLAAWCG